MAVPASLYTQAGIFVFLHRLHLMDICEIIFRIIITQKFLIKMKHTSQNLLQFFVIPFPHHPQLPLSCEPAGKHELRGVSNTAFSNLLSHL